MSQKPPTELKKYRKSPQKLRIVKVFENSLKSSDKSMGQLMKEQGYSKSMQLNPHQITKSKTWLELVDRYLPENRLLKTHKEALKATKIEHSPVSPDIIVPDYSVRLKAVELGYKVKGRLNEKPNIQNNVLVLPPEIIQAYKGDEKDV